MFTPEMLEILIERYADGSQKKFAEMLGLKNQQTITDWKKRGVNTLENIERIYKQFQDEISAEWLLTGDGEPFKQSASNNQSSTVVGNNVNGNGNHISANDKSNLVMEVLVKQLDEKDKQIASLIDKLPAYNNS